MKVAKLEDFYFRECLKNWTTTILYDEFSWDDYII